MIQNKTKQKSIPRVWGRRGRLPQQIKVGRKYQCKNGTHESWPKIFWFVLAEKMFEKTKYSEEFLKLMQFCYMKTILTFWCINFLYCKTSSQRPKNSDWRFIFIGADARITSEMQKSLVELWVSLVI